MKTGRQIDVWREGQIDGETDRLWMHELVDIQTDDKQTVKRTKMERQTDLWTYRFVDRHAGGWTDRQMTNRQSSVQKDGETDRQMDGQEDRQAVEWTVRLMNIQIPTQNGQAGRQTEGKKDS